MSTPTPTYTPVKRLFTGPRLARLRRAGLLPAPALVNGVRCYSDADLARLDALLATGSDRWMMTNHGRGRPSLADLARSAGVR